MRLLVSVASASEASAAVAGSADIIDAKNPVAGALGAVVPEVLQQIHAAVNGAGLVSAALGDAADETKIEGDAYTFAASGAEFLKVGFAGISTSWRVSALIAAAVRGARAGSDGRSGVVAVAYADADRVASLAPTAVVRLAARAGAVGLLLDTVDKDGPGLRGILEPAALAAWISSGHDAGLFVALAGRLTADDFPFVRDAGADIAGVRGAACEGGRTGHVVTDKVRLLRALCTQPGGEPRAAHPALAGASCGRSMESRGGAEPDETNQPAEPAKDAG